MYATELQSILCSEGEAKHCVRGSVQLCVLYEVSHGYMYFVKAGLAGFAGNS